MDVTRFRNLKMSLMEAQSDINEDTGKADYIVKGSANFTITQEFYVSLINKEKDDLTAGLLQAMYEELIDKIKDEVDTVGLWVDYDGMIFENSIKMSVLEDIGKFSVEEVTPIYEFFKMTIGETLPNATGLLESGQ